MEFPKFKNEYHRPGIELLPHRDPFLFVDELIAADETGALGKVTYGKNRDFFRGHFPSYPVVPGVILIESMAQVAGAATVARGLLGEGVAVFLLAAVDKVRFRRPVRPDETLYTVVTNIKLGRRLGVYGLKGYVGDELAAEAEVKCMLGENKTSAAPTAPAATLKV